MEPPATLSVASQLSLIIEGLLVTLAVHLEALLLTPTFRIFSALYPPSAAGDGGRVPHAAERGGIDPAGTFGHRRAACARFAGAVIDRRCRVRRGEQPGFDRLFGDTAAVRMDSGAA